MSDDNDTRLDNPALDSGLVPAPEFVPYTVTNKRGESFLVDGVNYKEIKQGVIISVETGKIVANPEGGKTNGWVSTESARLARSKVFERRLSGQLAAGRGLAIGAGSPSEELAIERLTAEQAKLAMQTDRGRASTEAYIAVMRVAGFLGTIEKSSDGDGSGVNQISMTDDGIKELRLFVQAIRGLDGDG